MVTVMFSLFTLCQMVLHLEDKHIVFRTNMHKEDGDIAALVNVNHIDGSANENAHHFNKMNTRP